MIADPIRRFLDSRGVEYRTLSHARRVTALESAQAAHVSGRRFAKSILLGSAAAPERRYVLAVLPADEQVDLERLSRALGYPVDLASEEELARKFPTLEVGAAPPFGELAGVAVIADACLATESTIVFSAGTHTDLIEMRWSDFVALVHPEIFEYGRARTPREPAPPLWSP